MSLFGRTYSDGDCLEIAGHRVRLKVPARARRVSPRLDRTRGVVVATAPNPRRLSEAANFAQDRADWIADRLAELPPATLIEPGMVISVFGQPCRLERGGRGASFVPATEAESARILARGEGEAYVRAVVRALKRHALEVLSARTQVHAAALSTRLPTVTIMDAKSRWGSCKPGIGLRPPAIRYSWRLALAPFEVADYVAAHECAHLLELNHGPRFWAHVQALIGDMRPHRDWLRAEAARLHAFGT